MADDHDRPPLQPANAADDRRILAERPVAGERREIVDQSGDIVFEMRPLGVARDDRLLPRRQARIDVGELAFGALGEAGGFGEGVGRAVGAELCDARLEFGDRFFEFEEGDHRRALAGKRRRRNARHYSAGFVAPLPGGRSLWAPASRSAMPTTR